MNQASLAEAFFCVASAGEATCKDTHMRIDNVTHIRPIQPADVPALLAILATNGLELPEPADHALYSNYQRARSLYLVALVAGEMAGGIGVAPLPGADPHTCELQRFVVRHSAPRRDIGEALLRHGLLAAKQFLYVRCYFEAGARGHMARRFYARHGFREVPANGRGLIRPLRASARRWMDCVPMRPSFDGVTACALLGAIVQ
jgi:putative acetyltransferase